MVRFDENSVSLHPTRHHRYLLRLGIIGGCISGPEAHACDRNAGERAHLPGLCSGRDQRANGGGELREQCGEQHTKIDDEIDLLLKTNNQ